MRPRRRLRAWAAAALLCGVLALAGTGTFSTFTSQADNPGNSVAAAADFRAPTVSSSVIAKSAGGTPGFIKQAGTYYVYANVTDTGNPASGILTVTANASNVTTGQTLVPLVSGSYSVGGVSYNYRSALLVADVTLSAGSKSYSITTTDITTNSATTGGFSVTVDNTAPTGSDIQSANHGATVGKAELSDTITYTFSEPIEPDTVLSGWTGSSTNVVVRLRNGGLLGILGNTDDAQIFNSADTVALPLGTVDLGRTDYVGGLLGGEILRFGATGTTSTMTMSGNSITITLGTASGSGSALTASGNGTMSWTPSATPTDRAANATSTAAATESGGADKEF
jgi:hypothetical protein